MYLNKNKIHFRYIFRNHGLVRLVCKKKMHFSFINIRMLSNTNSNHLVYVIHFLIVKHQVQYVPAF